MNENANLHPEKWSTEELIKFALINKIINNEAAQAYRGIIYNIRTSLIDNILKAEIDAE